MSRPLWVQRVCIALAAVGVYPTSVGGRFLKWDDNLYVTQSERVQRAGLEGLVKVWSADDVWAGRFVEFFPLRDTVYWVTWQLFGENAVAFHLVNIVAHAGVALLVLQLARRLGLQPAAAFWGAVLFAVHPIHVESVTWISALKDPLFTGLMLGSVLAFLRYRSDARPLDYQLCLALLVAALLVKSIAVAGPALMLMFDRWLEPRQPWRQSLKRVAAPAVIALLFLTQFVLMGRLNSVVIGPHGGSWGQHYFLMGWALVRYVQQAVAPLTFRIHYCFTPLSGPLDLRLLAIGVLVVGVVAALRFAWRKQRLAGALGLWFFICLAPVANVLPFPAIMADRYLYAPSVAACLLLSWGLGWLTEPRRWVLPLLAVLFGAVTLLRGAVWQDSSILWAEAVADDACLQDDLPAAAVMYLNYAATVGDPARSLAAYQKGIGHPQFHTLPPENQAIYLRKGLKVAQTQGEAALARRWSDLAVKAAPADADGWASRARTIGDPPLALEAAEHAFRLERSADTWFVLGVARLAMNRPEGVGDITAAIDLDPKKNCGFLLGWLGEKPSEPFREALAGLRQRCEDLAGKQ